MDPIIQCAKCLSPEKLEYHLIKDYVPLYMCPRLHIICLSCWRACHHELIGCFIPGCDFKFDKHTYPFSSKVLMEELSILCDIQW